MNGVLYYPTVVISAHIFSVHINHMIHLKPSDWLIAVD